MNFDRQRKIERIVLNAARAYHDGPMLKVPLAMANYGLTKQNYKHVAAYLALQFSYSGKVPISSKPQRVIANLIDVKPRTAYRWLKKLLALGWIEKNVSDGWIFIKGFDRVRDIEGWKYRRAAVMYQRDLKTVKEFLIGAVLSSIVKSGKAAGTEQPSRRSETSRWPVSLRLMQKVIGCSRKTAFTYRKDAKKAGYIKMRYNLPQVTGVSAKDVKSLKENNAEFVTVNIFGSGEAIDVMPQQLRTNKGFIYAQLANLITPMIQLRKR